MIRSIPVLLTLATLHVAAQEQHTAEGGTAEIIPTLIAAAQEGSTDAQHEMGHRYLTGEGVLRDVHRAAVWLRRAAGRGHADAQGELAQMHLSGTGMSRDYVAAHAWLAAASAGWQSQSDRRPHGDPVLQERIGRARETMEKLAAMMTTVQIDESRDMSYEIRTSAGSGPPLPEGTAPLSVHAVQDAARRGDVAAQWAMSYMFATGTVLPESPRRARVWLHRCAEQSHYQCQGTLSREHALGEQVPEDLVAAHVWATLAADTEHAEATALFTGEYATFEAPTAGEHAEHIADLHATLDLLEQLMTPEQVETAGQVALELAQSIRRRPGTAAQARLSALHEAAARAADPDAYERTLSLHEYALETAKGFLERGNQITYENGEYLAVAERDGTLRWRRKLTPTSE